MRRCEFLRGSSRILYPKYCVSTQSKHTKQRKFYTLHVIIKYHDRHCFYRESEILKTSNRSTNQHFYRSIPAMPSKLDSTPWRSNMFKEKEAHAWDVSNIDLFLEKGTNPRAPIETILRSLNTLRRCVEHASSNPKQIEVVLRHNSIVPVLFYWLRERVEPGASGARLKEHVLFVFINLLGHSALSDETIVMDESFLTEVVCRLVLDENSIVASAASQLIRRISELDHLVGALCFTDFVMNSVIEALVISIESREYICASHYLSAMINLTSNSKTHFSLARNRGLIRALLAILRQSATAATGLDDDIRLGTLAAKSLANLLYYPENTEELKDANDDLILTLTQVVQLAENADPDASALAAVASIALEYCHEKGVAGLERRMREEFQRSSASLPRVPGTNALRRNRALAE